MKISWYCNLLTYQLLNNLNSINDKISNSETNDFHGIKSEIQNSIANLESFVQGGLRKDVCFLVYRVLLLIKIVQ